MAHLGGGAEAHAWFEMYDYPLNSVMVVTNSRPGHTGEPDDSLRGKIDPKLFGDRARRNRPPDLEERLVSRSKKNKVRDVDPTDTEPVPTGQTKRRPPLVEEESVGLSVSDDDVVYDQPKTDESRASLLRTLNVLARGAAMGKLVTVNQDNRGDVNGTSATGNDNTDHEALDNDVGLAVESEPEDNEEEDDGSFYDALHEYALDNDVGVGDEFEENEEVHQHDDKKEDVGMAVEFKENNEEMDYDALLHDEKEDEYVDYGIRPEIRKLNALRIDVHEIDAYWLQRKFSKAYGKKMGPEKSKQFAEEVLKLLEQGKVNEVERVMFGWAGETAQFPIIYNVLGNRWKIVWCTRLARAENEEERKKIKKEMMSLGRPHTLVLKQLHMPPGQLQMRSKWGEAGCRLLDLRLGDEAWMKEERLKKKSETASEVEAWVSRSRKLEKGRVLDLSKNSEEQDDVKEEDNDDGDDDPTHHTTHDLSGVKVLHGIDKVLEGGAVVLTLKDQSILDAGGANEDLDELENIEFGKQKKRDDAYKAAKEKKGLYDDKFLDEPGSEKKILLQYDDPVADEGITLDASGRFTGEAEKKLEERIQGVPASRNFEDLNAPGRLLSDYYTPDEMLKFKKPKKSTRKKEKLDVDALEAEAVYSGLGVGDLGSRNDSKLQALNEQRERSEAEIRSSAYQAALAKADEASKTLRLGQIPLAESEEVDAPAIAIGDDDEEMQRYLARARRIALTKQEEVVKSGPQALALLASSTTNESGAENQNSAGAVSQGKKIVFTEMEGFFMALQQDEARAPDGKHVFTEEDDVPNTFEKEAKEEDSVFSEVKESVKVELPEKKEEEIAPENKESVAAGKRLTKALKLLKAIGALKESVEWGGRNMDKKKSKLAGKYDGGPKETHSEWTDGYRRILTPKESFRLLSRKFHGKGPGKMKQEKRKRQYQEELKVKPIANSDTPTHSFERIREALAQQKSPYVVLSGHVKPGQNNYPRSGFETVEKDFPGSSTPMLGYEKVEYLGKRKPGAGDTGSQKKPKT